MNDRRAWWRGAVLYQIYPRSFLDTSGSGVGDLQGIIRKLDYVASLGVDGVWISPFFKSPMLDFGYDVSDYRHVDPLFGTNADFEALLEAAHARDLKVLVDMVLSHTSHEHPWFEESRQSRDNPKADWYVWADPKPDGGPPNNWLANFGGPSWSWEPRREQYYFHNFLPQQPDLDLHNPEVLAAVLDECRFWLDAGVDGFRLDVANCYTHDRRLTDNPPNPKAPGLPRFSRARPDAWQLHVNDRTQPETLAVLEALRRLTDAYPDRVLVGEIWDRRWDEVTADYTDPGRLHTAYALPIVTATDVRQLRPLVERFERHGRGWPTYAFSNHDAPRVASRWGGPDAHPAFAKQMIALLLSLRGSAILYQGEELGLPEADVPFERLVDPPGRAFWPEYKGRDGARTPIPWDAALPQAGFSSAEPWLPVDPRHLAVAVSEQEADPDSPLAFTRRFTTWRRTQSALIEGGIRFRDMDEDLLAFEREAGDQRLLALFNLGEDRRSADLPPGARPILGHGLPHEVSGSAVSLPRWGGAYFEL